MTYKLNPELAKIKSPVIVLIDGKSSEFANGEALVDAEFDRPYLIDEVTAKDSKVVIRLAANVSANDINWVGEEQSFF